MIILIKKFIKNGCYILYENIFHLNVLEKLVYSLMRNTDVNQLIPLKIDNDITLLIFYFTHIKILSNLVTFK